MAASVKFIRDLTGAVLKVKNLDDVGFVMNQIVDQNGRMHQLADTKPSLDQTANVWEGSEEIDMISRSRSQIVPQSPES